MSPTSMVSSILLSLPSTVSSTTNLHILNVVGDVESMNNFHINHHHYGKSRFRKFQLMWYILMSAPFLVFPSNLATAYHIFAKKIQMMWCILMSATFLVFPSLLSMQFPVPSTIKPPEQKLGKWGIQERTFNEHHSAPVDLSVGWVWLKRAEFAKSALCCLLPFRS